jgi:hypothetical protein
MFITSPLSSLVATSTPIILLTFSERGLASESAKFGSVSAFFLGIPSFRSSPNGPLLRAFSDPTVELVTDLLHALSDVFGACSGVIAVREIRSGVQLRHLVIDLGAADFAKSEAT